jgi:hypothetical protein
MSFIKTMLMLIGVGFILLVLTLVLLIGWANCSDHGAAAFAGQSVRDVAAHWSKDALLRKAAPGFLETVSAHDLNAVLEKHRAIGALADCKQLSSSSSFTLTTPAGKTFKHTFTYQMKFEHGKLFATISVVRIDRVWKISHFDIYETEP